MECISYALKTAHESCWLTPAILALWSVDTVTSPLGDASLTVVVPSVWKPHISEPQNLRSLHKPQAHAILCGFYPSPGSLESSAIAPSDPLTQALNPSTWIFSVDSPVLSTFYK